MNFTKLVILIREPSFYFLDILVLMEYMKKGSNPLEDLSDEQIAELVKSNDALDQEQERIKREEKEEKERKMLESNSAKRFLRRLKRSPIEIINRCLFIVFLGGFVFSFVSVYAVNPLWFYLYVFLLFF